MLAAHAPSDQHGMPLLLQNINARLASTTLSAHQIINLVCIKIYNLIQQHPRPFKNDLSATMKLTLVASTLLSLAIAGPVASPKDALALDERQAGTRPVSSCEPGPAFCGMEMEECNAQLDGLRSVCTNRCLIQGISPRVECLSAGNLDCFC